MKSVVEYLSELMSMWSPMRRPALPLTNLDWLSMSKDEIRVRLSPLPAPSDLAP